VPLSPDGKEISSDKRIRASLPTIQYCLDQGAAVVLASHLGRPKGKRVAEMSLAPIAAKLIELLPGRKVTFASDCVGAAVTALKPSPGEVLLLENLRYHNEEEANDGAFAEQLAAMCDVYVNDAFGTAHRAHASTEGITHHVAQAAAGLLMDKELEYLGKAVHHPARPCVAIIGGAKVSDKIEVIENMLSVVDRLMIGGAMAYTFLKARGESIGKSLVEDDKLELARDLMHRAGAKLMLPSDHVVAEKFEANAPNQTVTTIPEGTMALDIGPATIATYEATIKTAKTIIWNGPMGVFELKPFDTGTVALAKAVASSGAITVVGGGDSEKAVKSAGVSDKISHVSTGGGASLEFLSGIELPGVKALTDK
jgi:phosphoglycerate kinase